MVCCVTLHNICVSSSLLKRPGTRECTKHSNSAITTNVCTFSSANAIVRFRWNESTDEDYTNTLNYPKQLLRYYHFFVLLLCNLDIELVENSIYLLV